MYKKSKPEEHGLPHDYCGDIDIPARKKDEQNIPPRKHDHVTSRVPDSPYDPKFPMVL